MEKKIEQFRTLLNPMVSLAELVLMMERRPEIKDQVFALAKSVVKNQPEFISKLNLITAQAMRNLNPDQIKSIIDSLGNPHAENSYTLAPDSCGDWWITHDGVGSGEPLRQWLENQSVLNKQVACYSEVG